MTLCDFGPGVVRLREFYGQNGDFFNKITHGPSAELGRGPPQAAWRGAVVHPSGGPSAPGRRCWRLGRKRPSPFFKLGAHSATLRPEFGGPKSLRCCCAKGVGHRAQLMLRARRGARENDYPVPLLRTPTPQKLSLSCPHSEHRGGSQLPSLSTSCHVADRERISSCSARRVAKAKVLPEPPGALTTWRRSPLYLYL